MGLLSRKNRPPQGVQRTWAACSALLDYPTEDLVSALDDVAALVPDNANVGGLIDHLRGQDVRTSQEEYVETFDHTRKCSLYLTYYAYGDTRRRGLALLEFKNAYRTDGVVWDDECGELPDHLCAVLQYGATVNADTTWALLNDHRAGVEMLRIALADWRNHDGSTGSPWHGAVRAVCDTLPTLSGDQSEAVRRLIAQGPPAENVGLGYGTDPALQTGPTLISGSTIPVGAPR